MEKGQESKQKRKTPLTTIAISQEYAKKLDEYLNGTGITRKEFVELSVDYFQRTGFDLRGEAFDLSPLEKVAGRLEQSAKIMEQHNEETEAVRLLLQTVREQTAKQLPAPELIAHAAEEKAKAEAKSEEQEREIARLRSENSALLDEEDYPCRPRIQRRQHSEQFEDNLARLCKLRDEKAEELGMEGSFLITRASLEAIAEDREKGVSTLLNWQREALGF